MGPGYGLALMIRAPLSPCATRSRAQPCQQEGRWRISLDKSEARSRMSEFNHSDRTGSAGEPAHAIGMDDLPVFQQRWWVEIARGAAHLNEAQVIEDNIVVGRLPYVVQRNKAGFKCGGLFHWTHMGGPVISRHLPAEAKAATLRQLLSQLPRNVTLNFVCRPAPADAGIIREAFKAAGFERSTVIAYSLPPDAESIINRLSRKHAKHLISADRRLDVIDISAIRFIKFYGENLEEAGKISHSPLNIARDLIAAGSERNPPQVRTLAAKKRSGKEGGGSLVANSEDVLDAAIACAWDNERYYLWMLTRRREAGPSGKPHPDAVKLLVIKAMEHARSLGLIFDSDGVGSAGSGHFYDRIMKIPKMEPRDSYERYTLMQGWTKKYPLLETAAWLIYSRLSLLPRWLMSNAVVRATAGGAAMLLVTTVILCGSLFPFEYYDGGYPNGPLGYLLSTWRTWDRGCDLLTNILLYVPFGFFASCALPWRLPRVVRALLATLASMALASGIETMQFYDVGRVTSMGDVYANGIGAGIGALAAALGGPLLRSRFVGKLGSSARLGEVLARHARPQ